METKDEAPSTNDDLKSDDSTDAEAYSTDAEAYSTDAETDSTDAVTDSTDAEADSTDAEDAEADSTDAEPEADSTDAEADSTDILPSKGLSTTSDTRATDAVVIRGDRRVTASIGLTQFEVAKLCGVLEISPAQLPKYVTRYPGTIIRRQMPSKTKKSEEFYVSELMTVQIKTALERGDY